MMHVRPVLRHKRLFAVRAVSRGKQDHRPKHKPLNGALKGVTYY
jgi:hypothetical protein